MNWNEMIYGLGDFFWWAFEGLEALNNPFNYTIMLVGGAMMLWWISQLVKFANENKDTPTAE